MNGGRRMFEPQTARPPRRNRLSRSFRQSQAGPAKDLDPHRSPRENISTRSCRQSQTGLVEVLESTRSQREPEFKTPTRISRSKPTPVPSVESPHNDSDFQQDIIWDATSPLTNRFSKRGKKPAAGLINISEIVTRIAPKHGRPRVAEPTLQQWIGDSASIPCTPDVQAPRAKKKSPRPNGVEDLLRLARQFDLNLFHQDEEEGQSLEKLLTEDILDTRSQGQGSLPRNLQLAVNAAAGSDPQPHTDQQLQDDLDFLFDGPTQKVCGNLSQASMEVSRKPSMYGSASGDSRMGNKHDLVHDTFEDDWDNDDLLNDSLVLEMTQNPLTFMAPKLCSTQKPADSVRTPDLILPGQSIRDRVTPHQGTVGWVTESLVTPGQNNPGWVAPSVKARTEKENLRPRAVFQLEWTSDFSGKRIQADMSMAQQVDCSSKDSDQNRFPFISGPQQTGKTGQTSSLMPESQRSQSTPRNSAGRSISAVTLRSDVVDFLDEDLDSLFSSEPVWDDPADDDLLCEMCDDLENKILIQVQVKTDPSARQTPVLSNQRAALQPTHRTCENRIRTDTSGLSSTDRPAGSSLAAGASVQVKQPIRFLQPKPAADAVFRRLQTNTSGSEPSAVLRTTINQHFTFKKPSNLVTMATGKGENTRHHRRLLNCE
ncbi:hypothetical protein CRENBAI_011211 [Crenichthys baileyi]|uniref:Ewing's tumor-associated antigen 1 n=1 Tax=Crenichthys baileyi TaxID=28760 RepID=A0AAV9S584_9TELE